MKIKTKKQLNLPQLIEWAWENGMRGETFLIDSNQEAGIHFDGDCDFKMHNADFIRNNDLFTVEVEEEITEDTVFHTLVKVIEDGTVYTCTDATINREKNSAVVEIHAILNGVLKLIWTHDKGLVE